jgi:hypothetical protein
LTNSLILYTRDTEAGVTDFGFSDGSNGQIHDNWHGWTPPEGLNYNQGIMDSLDDAWFAEEMVDIWPERQ